MRKKFSLIDAFEFFTFGFIFGLVVAHLINVIWG